MEYFITNKFTLIPNEFYNLEENIIAFKNLFNLPDTENVLSKDIEKLNAKLLYCNERPFIEYLIEYSYKIKEYNKVLVHYDQSQKILHLVIYKGETLELANTYTANCFKTALYYIFLSLKQTIINPQQTILRVFNTLSQEELQLIEKYFNGTEIINSEDKIIK